MLTTFFVCSQAFWWSSPTTEPTPTVKQIPVGYFRTYTYQPLSYPPSYYPYGGGSHHSFTAGSGPFGSWSQRQSFSNNPTSSSSSSSSSSPGLSALKLQAPQPVPITTQTPPPPPPPQPQPTQPPTQSPPTQYIHHINPSTSQSQTGPVQPQPYSNLPIVEAHPPSSSSPNIQLQSSSLPHQSQIMNNNNNNNGFQSSHSLPQYYQSPSLTNQDLTQNYHHYYSSNLPVQQIQFVPCMCPVSVSISSSEYPENRSDHLVEDESLLERNDQNLKDETL